MTTPDPAAVEATCYGRFAGRSDRVTAILTMLTPADRREMVDVAIAAYDKWLADNGRKYEPISADWWWCRTHDDELGPFYCCTRKALKDCDPVAVYRLATPSDRQDLVCGSDGCDGFCELPPGHNGPHAMHAARQEGSK